MGTTNRIAKFNGGTASVDSQLFDDGTNVGLNSTTPAFPLHLKPSSGNDILGLESASGAAGLVLKSGTTTVVGILKATTTLLTLDAHQANQELALITNANNEQGVYIKAGGNVGIGLDNPSVRLHVKQASGAEMVVLETTSGAPNLLFRPGGTQAGELKKTTTLFEINANNALQDLALETQGINTQGVYIKAGGNVGIGTTSPAEKLEVNGNLKVVGDVKFFGTNSFGTQSPSLGSNAPAAMVTPGAPYTWIRAVANDGTTVWIPAWK